MDHCGSCDDGYHMTEAYYCCQNLGGNLVENACESCLVDIKISHESKCISRHEKSTFSDIWGFNNQTVDNCLDAANCLYRIPDDSIDDTEVGDVLYTFSLDDTDPEWSRLGRDEYKDIIISYYVHQSADLLTNFHIDVGTSEISEHLMYGLEAMRKVYVKLVGCAL